MRGSVLLTLLLASAPGYAADASAALDALQERISSAGYHGDADALEAARAEALERRGDDEAGFLAGYYSALASFRIGEIVADDRRRARAALDSCIDELESLLDGREGTLAAEGHALLAGCYGSSTAYYRPPRVIMRGNRAQRNLDRAAELGPGNPRVLLQDALSDYSRPAMFGGDVDRALRKLEQVTGLFAEGEPPPPGYPSWGEADAWFYIGRIREARGDTTNARRAFTRALELAPGFRLAEDALNAL